MIKLKLNWLSYASNVACQPLGHSKCDKICDTVATTSRRGKVLIFKPKATSFYATEFSYISIFPYKIDQIFGFWPSQRHKLRKNTRFRGFKSSLAVNSHVAKPERLALSKMWTSPLCLSKGAHMTTTSFQSAWGIWVKISIPEMAFQVISAKVEISFSS